MGGRQGKVQLHQETASYPPSSSNNTVCTCNTHICCGQANRVLGPSARTHLPLLQVFPVDVLREAASLGLAGLYVPEEYGGSGLGRLDGALAFEGLSYGDISTAAYLTIHNMVRAHIHTHLLLPGDGTIRRSVLSVPACLSVRCQQQHSAHPAGATTASPQPQPASRSCGQAVGAKHLLDGLLTRVCACHLLPVVVVALPAVVCLSCVHTRALFVP